MPEASRLTLPELSVSADDERVALTGELRLQTLAGARKAIAREQVRVLDLAGLTGLDTSGALFLCELRDHQVKLEGIGADHQSVLDLVCGLEREPLSKPAHLARWRELVIQLGRAADQVRRDTLDIVTFVGRSTSALRHALLHPTTLRPASISRQIAETGITALPIIALMAIMISFVIGYQSVVQLRPFGADDLTIDLIAVSLLREMAVLITAIMVAGRSGSAFTAEIGVMRAREEVDALQVMGLDPMELLVVPRLIGLVITLPLLTFFADVMGLIGGALISHSLLQVAPLQYIDRVRHAVDASDLLVGLIKAPVFGFFIGVIGCMHGLRVRGSAESVGRETTRAVVKAIFLVIVFDALFSILFEKLDL
jgi:phospholipid/cholesterol/gamma-HCH transport system permease protein